MHRGCQESIAGIHHTKPQCRISPEQLHLWSELEKVISHSQTQQRQVLVGQH